jgi:hypothetical protein
LRLIETGLTALAFVPPRAEFLVSTPKRKFPIAPDFNLLRARIA